MTEGHINSMRELRPGLLSWPFIFLLILAKSSLYRIVGLHDAPRKRPSQHSWFGLLGQSPNSVDLHFLLWYVPIARVTISSTSLGTGVFVVLFSASVVIFVLVFSFRKAPYFSTRPDPKT